MYPADNSTRINTIIGDVVWMLVEGLAFIGGMAGLVTIVIIAAAFAGK
jgi:hypothetical protein